MCYGRKNICFTSLELQAILTCLDEWYDMIHSSAFSNCLINADEFSNKHDGLGSAWLKLIEAQDEYSTNG